MQNDFDVEHVPTFYQLLRDRAGYHTMLAGRDDFDKASGGPGGDGSKHTAALGFVDAARCDGSTDVTSGGTPHEPFGRWLEARPVTNASVRRKYGNASNLFELLAARFGEIFAHTDRYAIPDPLPLPDEAYQDNWIGARALELLERRPRDRPVGRLSSNPHGRACCWEC